MNKERRVSNRSIHNKSDSISLKYVFLIITALTLIVYGQTLNFSFTWFDDDAILLRNEAYISDFSNVIDAVTRDAEFQEKNIELYRPMQNVSFMVDAKLYGFNPGLFHLTNMLIHVATSILLFLLLSKLGFRQKLALWGTSLFTLHPICAFTLSWLPARGDLLLAFWAILSIWLFIVYLDNRKPFLLIAHIFSFGMAVFAKESGVITAVVCFIYYLFFMKNISIKKWHFAAGAGYLIFTALFLYFRDISTADVIEGNFGLMPLLKNFPVIPEVILKFVIPYPIITVPFYEIGRTLAGLAIIIILIALIIKIKPNIKISVWAAFWFFLFIIPSMFYYPDWSEYIYDYLIHRSYLPLVGLVIVILSLIKPYSNTLFKKPAIYLSIGVLIIFMVLSFNFARVFENPKSFWSHSAKTNPSSAFAHLYLGGAYFYYEEPIQAINSYNKALELKSDFLEAIQNRAIAYASINQHKKAIEDFSHALEIKSDDTLILKYRATSYFELKNYKKVRDDTKELMRLGSFTEQVRLQFAISSLILGYVDDAKMFIDELLKKEPENIIYLRVSALADLLSGNVDDAINKQIKILTFAKPTQFATANLGHAYYEKGLYSQALQNYLKADEMGDDDESVIIGLMLTYDAKNELQNRDKAKERLIALRPQFENFEEGMKSLSDDGYIFTEKQISDLERIF